MGKLAIVVPCYNEEEMLPLSVPELLGVLTDLVTKKKIDKDSYLLLVNDGSKDKTWDIISQFNNDDKRVRAIKLTRNRGHQNALMSGLFTAAKDADVTISIDADLQDDISVMEEMIDFYNDGCHIVYGIRSSRETDSFFKRFTAESYYRFLNFMGVESVYNHADYRLMSATAIRELSKYEESNIYLRGIIPLIGYKTASVSYKRKKRVAGESKYPLTKMIALAFDGITSFSIKPINFIIGLGIVVLIFAFLAAVYAFVSYFLGDVEKGWTSIILSIWFLGGVQLLSVGIIGEYVGKIYKEVKHRPKFTVETYLGDPSEDKQK